MRGGFDLMLLAIFALFVIGFVFLFNHIVDDMEGEYEAEIQQLEEEVQELRNQAIDSQKLIKKIEELKDRNEEMQDKIEEWLEDWEITSAEVTSYAPLCEEAVPGWDYSGDPSITASGGRVVPGRTAAGPADVPFGSIIYVDGHGFYEINDRGGMIGYNSAGHPQFDLTTESKAEAQAIGRVSAVVAIKERRRE